MYYRNRYRDLNVQLLENSLTDIKVYIDDVLAGNTQAFEKIVLQYQSMVFSICFNVLKQRVVAEEAAQDVFVKVYKKLSSFEERSSFKTWIYRIAFRTAIDHQRKRKLLTTSIDQEDRPLQLADGSKTSQEAMEMVDRQTALESAIRKLDGEDSVLISLYYFEEKNVKEVSEVLGLTESNVKIKLFRARKKLKVLLENENL